MFSASHSVGMTRASFSNDRLVPPDAECCDSMVASKGNVGDPIIVVDIQSSVYGAECLCPSKG